MANKASSSRAHVSDWKWSNQQAVEEARCSEGMPRRWVRPTATCRALVPPIFFPHEGARRISLPTAGAHEQQPGLPLLTSQALEQHARAQQSNKNEIKSETRKRDIWNALQFLSCVDPTDDVQETSDEEPFSPWTARAIIWEHCHHSCGSNEGYSPSQRVPVGNCRELHCSCDTSYLFGALASDRSVGQTEESYPQVQQSPGRAERGETWMSWLDNLFR